MKYCQNNESEIIEGYFGQFVGTLLSIGENDGIQLSNCRSLMEKGWSGIMVEPSVEVFKSLNTLYGWNDNPKVWCFNVAISDFDGDAVLYDSGEHLGKGDRALLSTINVQETKRWNGTTKFESKHCLVWKVETLLKNARHIRGFKTYDFISIDAEGEDLTILRQMELDQLGCKCLCIEHNSLPAVVANIREYCYPFGLKEIAYNGENIILAK